MSPSEPLTSSGVPVSSVQSPGQSTHHGLAFLALAAFVLSFLLARAFTTIAPNTVVVTGGVHFHHFWYGLLMVAVSGWLGISRTDPRLTRAYSVVFGFGGGLIGDETGLLLTLGNYHSGLTYFAVVLIVAIAGLLILLGGYRKQLEYDVFSTPNWERAAYLGIATIGASALPLAVGFVLPGITVLVLGALVVIGAVLWHNRRRV